MKLGIVGLPNVGKSTLFNAITNTKVDAANYPFCTIEPNIGAVAVPDERLSVLTKMYNPLKVIPAIIEFVDIAGLVKGASKGEGLGNKFLSHIREVDAIAHLVRCFDDTNITHVEGNVDPLRDIEVINLELIFADLDSVERRLEKAKKAAKLDKRIEFEADLFEKVKAVLESGKLIRNMDLTHDEFEFLNNSHFLTIKPVVFVANMGEKDFVNREENKYYKAVSSLAESEGCGILPICVKTEEEISELEADEKQLFLSDLGLKESGLERLIKESYSLLGLISYLTAGPMEVRAWTITKGTKAPQAAGKIHSDFERGFIRAEVVSFKDLVASGSMNAAKEKGLVRSEGKEYEMKDGDVVLYRFNV